MRFRLSTNMKKPPIWMLSEDGDEAVQQVADELRAKEEGEAEAESPAQNESQPTDDSEKEAPEDAEEGLSELERLEADYQDLKNKFVRLAADFENFRKRARRDQQDALIRGREEVLKEILGVLDNFERALDAADTQDKKEKANSAIIEGITLVQKQLKDGIGRFGLKEFSAVGQAFDPNFHEAIGQIETDEHPAGMVITEYQKGYMLGERLTRPAMVVVARPPASPVEKDESTAKSDASTHEHAEGADEETQNVEVDAIAEKKQSFETDDSTISEPEG